MSTLLPFHKAVMPSSLQTYRSNHVSLGTKTHWQTLRDHEGITLTVSLQPHLTILDAACKMPVYCLGPVGLVIVCKGASF